jgi:hypothetical protein
VGATEKETNEFLFGSFDIPLVNLEASLKNYVHYFTLNFAISV